MEKTQASSREQLVLSFRNSEWSGTSLVAQWLGPCAFTDEGRGSISCQGTKIHKPHSTAHAPPPKRTLVSQKQWGSHVALSSRSLQWSFHQPSWVLSLSSSSHQCWPAVSNSRLPPHPYICTPHTGASHLRDLEWQDWSNNTKLLSSILCILLCLLWALLPS